MERVFIGSLSNVLVNTTAHRHVAKTGDIKNFVITEESGIAKGIRRIIAVTGEDAREADQRVADMRSRLHKIATMPDHKAQEAALKAFGAVSPTIIYARCSIVLRSLVSQESAQVEGSALRKAELKDAFAALKKQIDEVGKARDKEESKKVATLLSFPCPKLITYARSPTSSTLTLRRTRTLA